MNADHAAQLRLLDLQAADTALAQLQHRRRSLPELAALAENGTRREAAHHEVVDRETRAADLGAEQRKIENEVDAVRTRTERDQQRLQSGGVPAKELEGLQHELTSLARRQGTLEDDLLEIMEQVETIEGELGERRAVESTLTAEHDDLVQRRDAATTEIDEAVAVRTAERGTVAAELPADLVALYEKARAHGGTGAALLRQRRCDGCRIELSGSELSALRQAAPDAVVRCENCRAILVRTDESGL